jgi:hypothetical protein
MAEEDRAREERESLARLDQQKAYLPGKILIRTALP